MPAHKHRELFLSSRSAIISRQWSGTVSWVLLDESGAHPPPSLVIKLGIRHPRKKERQLSVEELYSVWKNFLSF